MAKDKIDDVSPSAPQPEAAATKEQLSYLGGELEEIDTADLTAEDRGDLADPKLIEEAAAAAEAKKKEEDEAADKDSDDDSKPADDDKSDESADDGDGDEAKDDDKAGDDSGEGSDAEGDAKEDDKGDDSDGDKDDDSDDGDSKSVDDKPTIQGIPKHRFDEVNDRAKTAEAELKRRDDAIVAAKEAEENAYDFDAAEAEYFELVVDGKKEAALAKRSEIRAAEKEDFKREAKSETIQDVELSVAEREVQDMTDQAEEMYPVFDRNHADYNEQITEKALAFYRGYLVSPPSSVKTASDAIVMAIADVVEMYSLKAVGEVDEIPPEDKKPDELPPKKDLEKKLKLAEDSKPALADTGKASADLGVANVGDMETMTDEEFDALPASKQARLRGDFVE